MGAKVTGIEAALNALDKEVLDKMNTMAENIVTDATANTPVGKTGRLKSSWVLHEAKSTSEPAVVENTAPYAAYVEHGTEKTQPALMLTNAIDREMNKK